MQDGLRTPSKNYSPLQLDELYQRTILESVSRTFALTIPLLPPELEKVVGNTYLLCRIVDTIEDASCINAVEKQKLSALFIKTVLGNADYQEFVNACEIALVNHSNPDEKDLIQEKVKHFNTQHFDLLIFTGGTGLSPRDITTEALAEIIDRRIPGVEEAMRT